MMWDVLTVVTLYTIAGVSSNVLVPFFQRRRKFSTPQHISTQPSVTSKQHTRIRNSKFNGGCTYIYEYVSLVGARSISEKEEKRIDKYSPSNLDGFDEESVHRKSRKIQYKQGKTGEMRDERRQTRTCNQQTRLAVPPAPDQLVIHTSGFLLGNRRVCRVHGGICCWDPCGSRCLYVSAWAAAVCRFLNTDRGGSILHALLHSEDCMQSYLRRVGFSLNTGGAWDWYALCTHGKALFMQHTEMSGQKRFVRSLRHLLVPKNTFLFAGKGERTIKLSL